MTDKYCETPIAPLVHMNGTSAKDLLEQFVDACHALREAIAAVNETAPNQRDFYTLPETAWAQARAEHEARLHRLHSVLAELDGIAENVADQQAARENRKH